MDPVASLKEQREVAARILRLIENSPEDVVDEIERLTEEAERLSDLVLALDEWRKDGGFGHSYDQPVVMNVGEFNEDRNARLRSSIADAENYYGQQFEKESH